MNPHREVPQVQRDREQIYVEFREESLTVLVITDSFKVH